MRVEAFVQWSGDEGGGADRDRLGACSRPRQPPGQAGGRSEEEGEDAHAFDGHQWPDHPRDARAVCGFEAGELLAGNETHQRVVHDLHHPDHPEHPHRADHLCDGGDFGYAGVHIWTSATTAK